jgi:ABC-type polysaccharide/polyol phosphate transport system ATPase subunit
VEQSTSYPIKSGPIHLPNDGRPTDVQVLNLVKTFDKIEAVKGVSFTISKGEIFGLLGGQVRLPSPLR